MTIEHVGPNAEQIKYWNEISGQKWIARQSMLDGQLETLGRMAMDRAGITPGHRVLDVGCGCGTTSLELARRVGPSGSVTGIDLSTAMLERAREAARTAGLSHVRFENADAQTREFPPEAFDVVYSRFGVMFFSDPVAAFANLRNATRRGGRLAFVCWRSPLENPWVMVPLGAAARHVPLPPPPPPDAPGPFAFADAARVRDILVKAGFEAPEFEQANEVLSVGGGAGAAEAAEFLVQVGPVSHVLREAGSETIACVSAELRRAIEQFATPQGVRMLSAAWIVTARRP